jgi:hypothetical protein
LVQFVFSFRALPFHPISLSPCIRKFPSEAPVNFFNRVLIRDAIRETQGFGSIRSAGGSERRFGRSIRRIERPAKSNKRERRKHGGNAAVNDVTSDSASCFDGGFFLPSFFFGIFRAKFQKSLQNSEKRSV